MHGTSGEVQMPNTGESKKTPRTLGKSGDQRVIDDLMARLANEDGLVRQQARAALLKKGKSAVPALIAVLADRHGPIRLEAARVLCEFGDPRAAEALVAGLEDSESGIRWLAADGLMIIGRPALAPLLRALTQRSDSVLLRDGARRVMHGLMGRDGLSGILRPVLDALNSAEPAVTVPHAAHAALAAL